MFKGTQIPVCNKGWRPKFGFIFCAWKIFSLLQTHVTLTNRPAASHLHLWSFNLPMRCSETPPHFKSECAHQLLQGTSLKSPSTAICSIYTEAGWFSPFSHTTLMTLHNSTYHSITITMVMINMNMQIWGWRYIDQWLSAFPSKVLNSIPRIMHPNNSKLLGITKSKTKFLKATETSPPWSFLRWLPGLFFP